MKAIEQYFHVVLFILLYKLVPTFKSVDESLVCDLPRSQRSVNQYLNSTLELLTNIFCICFFSGFFPVVINFLRRVPIIGNILNFPGISLVCKQIHAFRVLPFNTLAAVIKNVAWGTVEPQLLMISHLRSCLCV